MVSMCVKGEADTDGIGVDVEPEALQRVEGEADTDGIGVDVEPEALLPLIPCV